jgi:fatty acid desaturase
MTSAAAVARPPADRSPAGGFGAPDTGHRGRLKGAHDLLGALALAWAWGPIIAALALFGWRPGPLTFALAFVVVGGRQHALDILAHEAWHYTVFRRRWLNNVAGAWLCAFPNLSRFTGLRKKHFEHHRKVGTRDDPDRYYWGWRPSERVEFVKHHLFVLSGLWFVRHLLGGARKASAPAPHADPEDRPQEIDVPPCREDRAELAGLAIWHLAALGAFAATVGWIWYFLLWLLPVLTLRVFLGELRQFLEHRHGRLLVYNTHPVERFFVGPFNFHLHAYHHAYPQEPWFVLPALGEASRRKCPDIVDYDTYLGELADYLVGRDRHQAPSDIAESAWGDASDIPASPGD